MRNLVLTTVFTALTAAGAAAQTYGQIAPLAPLAPAAGGHGTSVIIVGSDGAYLGRLNRNPYDPESISNPYGRYGGPYSPTSVRNPYSAYGSPYSSESAFNEFATAPPKVLWGGEPIGPLTTNPYLNGAINPYRALFGSRRDR